MYIMLRNSKSHRLPDDDVAPRRFPFILSLVRSRHNVGKVSSAFLRRRVKKRRERKMRTNFCVIQCALVDVVMVNHWSCFLSLPRLLFSEKERERKNKLGAQYLSGLVVPHEEARSPPYRTTLLSCSAIHPLRPGIYPFGKKK